MPNQNFAPRDVLAVLEKMPKQVWVRDPVDPRYLNVLKRGEQGYFPVTQHPKRMQSFTPHDMNKDTGATPQQIYAMYNGSMFGFHVPAADPDFWTAEEAQDWLDSLDKRAAEMFEKYGAPEPRRIEVRS